MEAYEIHVLSIYGKPSVYVSSHASDHAAVRRAKLLAREGDAVEVWRGETCVYSGRNEAAAVNPFTARGGDSEDRTRRP